MSVTVLIVSRHERVRSALWSLLSAEPGIEPITATGDAGDLAWLLGSVAPAVAVVDESAFGMLPELAAGVPATRFVMVGMHDHPGFVTRAREAGATDYVCLDEPERLVAAVAGTAALAKP
jgi:DNA-binding NarL/FixJ family response regulator